MESSHSSVLPITKHTPSQQQEQDYDQPNSKTPLLSSSSSSKSTILSKIIYISFLLTTFISLISALLFFSSPKNLQSAIRPQLKLPHPVVILISSDGFRFGYQFKAPTPNIHRLIKNGTEAEMGLIPVFPTLTFPNHYSIVTGLYPPYHGIINNYFVDPITGDKFTMSNHDPKWWLGEPLWETVSKHGKKAATYFWPGSEVKKNSWDCPINFCMNYNGSVPFEDRVDQCRS